MNKWLSEQAGKRLGIVLYDFYESEENLVKKTIGLNLFWCHVVGPFKYRCLAYTYHGVRSDTNLGLTWLLCCSKEKLTISLDSRRSQGIMMLFRIFFDENVALVCCHYTWPQSVLRHSFWIQAWVTCISFHLDNYPPDFPCFDDLRRMLDCWIDFQTNHRPPKRFRLLTTIRDQFNIICYILHISFIINWSRDATIVVYPDRGYLTQRFILFQSNFATFGPCTYILPIFWLFFFVALSHYIHSLIHGNDFHI